MGLVRCLNCFASLCGKMTITRHRIIQKNSKSSKVLIWTLNNLLFWANYLKGRGQVGREGECPSPSLCLWRFAFPLLAN